MTMLVHCFLLEGVAFREARLLMLSWWCLALLLQEIDHYSETFLFVILLIFWLCASILPVGHRVVARLYVIGILILIYAPYKKISV
jgi:hypothetical protein